MSERPQTNSERARSAPARTEAARSPSCVGFQNLSLSPWASDWRLRRIFVRVKRRIPSDLTESPDPDRIRGEGMEGERKSKGERGQGAGRWHTKWGRVVGGDRRDRPSYGGKYTGPLRQGGQGHRRVAAAVRVVRCVGCSGRGRRDPLGRRRTCCRTSEQAAAGPQRLKRVFLSCTR